MDTNLGASQRPEINDGKWENYEYSPASQKVNGTTMAIGIGLRALCVMMLTFGLMLFIDNAFALGSGGFALFIRALLPTAAFAFLFAGGKKGLLIGAGLTAVSVAFLFITASNPIGCATYAFDSAMRHLVSIGYDNYSLYITGASNMDMSAPELHRGAFALIGMALSFVFSLCTIRKTVLIPTLLISIGALTVGFTFNISTSNWGFSFTLLALVGIIVMKGFDASFKAKRGDRLKVAYLGGFVGGTVMLLAFLTVLIPSIVMKDQWKDIEFISRPVSVARDIVDSVITGSAPNLKDMGVIKNMDEFNSRDTSLKHQTFTGEQIIRIESSYSKDVPLYLRGWVATDFDGKSWTTVTNDRLASYMDRFEIVAATAGYTEGAYRTEYMTEAFYQMVIPDLLYVDPEKGYTNNYNNGFIAMYLNVKMELGAGTGNVLFLPSVTDSNGLYQYGNIEKAYKQENRSYFDGMFVTGWLNLRKEYTVKSYAPIMSSNSFSASLQNELNYFNAMRELMRWHKTSYNAATVSIKKAEVMAWYGLGELVETETYFDKYLEMSEEEQNEAYYRYVYLTNEYKLYANETYGKDSNAAIDVIDKYAENILKTLDPDAFTHDKVIAVVQFLYDNYSYSLTPRLPTSYGGYDGFLRETREGYCVQFATTMTLILRSMGIPARYVEGYLASDFRRAEDYEETGNYECIVTDQQAHAWVEVYYDGLGWLPYEATPKFVKSYYGSLISLGGESGGGSFVPGEGTDTDFGTPPADENPSEGELPPEPVEEPFPTGKVLMALLIIVGIGVLGFFVWKGLRDRADAALAERRRLITDAINGNIEEDQFNRSAQELNYEILRMFDLGGASPVLGELPMEYAARLEKESLLGKEMPFTEIMALIQKQEFGHGVSRAELSKIAEYLDSLWKDVYRTSGKAKRFWNRYFRCAI